MNAFPNPDDIAREHADALATLDFDKVIEVLPDVIDSAMRTTLPDEYTPEAAAAIAAAMTAELRHSTGQPGTNRAQRWGCPAWCVEEHGTPGAMDAHSTRPVESTLLAADLDCSGYSTGSDNLPWLTAQVVVINDKPQAYGRETRVWLGYGVHLAELSPAKARQALDAMRAFTDQLAQVVDDAERIAADDFDGDPEIARLDMEAQDRRAGRKPRTGGAA